MDLKFLPIEIVSIEKIKPYEFNNKTHTEGSTNILSTSISRYGFTQPIVVDEDNVVLAGHGRLIAAKNLGAKEVQISILRGLSDEEKIAYRIVDNKTSKDTDYNLENLQLEVEKLMLSDYPMLEVGLQELTTLVEIELPKLNERDYDPDNSAASMDSYQNGVVRQIVLYFDVEGFQSMMQKIEQISERHGPFKSNTAAVCFAVDELLSAGSSEEDGN